MPCTNITHPLAELLEPQPILCSYPSQIKSPNSLTHHNHLPIASRQPLRTHYLLVTLALMETPWTLNEKAYKYLVWTQKKGSAINLLALKETTQKKTPTPNPISCLHWSTTVPRPSHRQATTTITAFRRGLTEIEKKKKRESKRCNYFSSWICWHFNLDCTFLFGKFKSHL